MKVIITVESYYPLKNGVQEITQRYAEFLANSGCNVVVVTQAVENVREKENINGVEVRRVHVKTNKSIYSGDIKAYIELIICLSKDADVLVNVCTQTALTDCLLRHLPEVKCKKILYLHGIAHFEFPTIPTVDIHDYLSWLLNVTRWKPFYQINRKYLSMYDAIIHLHQKDKSYIMTSGLRTRNYVLENCTVEKMDSLDIERKKKPDSPYIMIANYLHDKNQELAIRAYFLSSSRRPFVFVGSRETEYLIHLKNIVSEMEKEYGRKKVLFVLGEDHSTTMKRLAGAYGLIHSSKSEKYPVVICEAQRSRTPFICTDTGVCKYLPGGIAIKDLKSMKSAIDEIETDCILWNQLSSEGYRYSIENQCFEKNCDMLRRILEQV